MWEREKGGGKIFKIIPPSPFKKKEEKEEGCRSKRAPRKTVEERKKKSAEEKPGTEKGGKGVDVPSVRFRVKRRQLTHKKSGCFQDREVGRGLAA